VHIHRAAIDKRRKAVRKAEQLHSRKAGPAVREGEAQVPVGGQAARPGSASHASHVPLGRPGNVAPCSNVPSGGGLRQWPSSENFTACSLEPVVFALLTSKSVDK